MGRKALHTQEEVFAAADRMSGAGEDVTASALLATLGGGSLTTIYKHLEAWEAAHKDKPRPVMIDMPEAVRAAFAQAWQAAALEAGKEVAATREKADAEVKAMTKRFDEALANIERLEAEANDEAAKSEAMSDKLATQDKALQDMHTKTAALTATVEQMRQQIEAQQAELERVHAEAESERQARKQESERLTGEIERERQAAETIRQQAAEDANRQRQENERQGAEIAKLTALLETEREKQSEQQRRTSEAEAALNKAQQETSAAKEAAARLQGQVEAMTAQHAEWAKTFRAEDTKPGKRQKKEGE
jgi:chromosome segregation ATPase